MRVLVTGGRDYRDRDRVFAELDARYRAARRDFVVIQGGATGADALAREWAYVRGAEGWHLRMLNFPADWTKHGRAAGPLRNAQMIAEGLPDLVLAFPGGRGTADMVRKAMAAGIEVRKVSASCPGGTE